MMKQRHECFVNKSIPDYLGTFRESVVSVEPIDATCLVICRKNEQGTAEANGIRDVKLDNIH